MNDRSLEGKIGVIFGVANQHSIAWGIAQACAAAGAHLIFAYQNERRGKQVKPLIEGLGLGQKCPAFSCDVQQDGDIATFFEHVREHTKRLDFLIHSVAFAPGDAFQGSFRETKREDFHTCLDVSVFSLLALANAVEPFMDRGGSITTLTYHGSQKVYPHYKIMGVAKAALESSIRYLAAELGPKGIRANAISAGPVSTSAARGIPGFGDRFDQFKSKAPLLRSCTLEELGAMGVFLAGDKAAAITGQVLYVDGGGSIMGS